MLKFRILIKFTFLLFFNFSSLIQAETSFRELAHSAMGASENVEYFAEFYSYEGGLSLSNSFHTFGRFVKTVNGKATQKVDISWLPKSQYLRREGRTPLFSAVPGQNHTFEETQILAGQKTIQNHGKFLINEEIFKEAMARKNFLESGNVDYKFPASADSDTGMNSFHALMGVMGKNPANLTKDSETTEAAIKYFLDNKTMKQIQPPSNGDKTLTASSLPFSRSAKAFLAESQSKKSIKSIKPSHATERP